MLFKLDSLIDPNKIIWKLYLTGPFSFQFGDSRIFWGTEAFHWVLIQRPESICGSACCVDAAWLLLETALYSSWTIYSSGQCSGSFCPGFIKCSPSVFSWSNCIQQFVIIFNKRNASLTSLKVIHLWFPSGSFPLSLAKEIDRKRLLIFDRITASPQHLGLNLQKATLQGTSITDPPCLLFPEKNPHALVCTLYFACVKNQKLAASSPEQQHDVAAPSAPMLQRACWRWGQDGFWSQCVIHPSYAVLDGIL